MKIIFKSSGSFNRNEQNKINENDNNDTETIKTRMHWHTV